jgi:glycosyltransferase involved in cell wall biosynthesis
MALVSIIIPTFNRSERVLRALSSIFLQTFTDYEIVVVDDGSTDQTKEALDQFRSKIAYVRHSSNFGVSAARNTGIRASSGLYLAFLDSDDSWLPEKLAAQVGFFERHPCTVACQTDEIWMKGTRRVNPKKRHHKPSGDIFLPSLKRCLVSPSAVMLKRSLLNEVGLFDEGLPVCEDYDLWLRIAARHPIYLIQEKLIVKEGGHSDQLSCRFRGMDKFRIKALVKLIRTGFLTERQLDAAFGELAFKCEIYGKGCLKRNRTEEGGFYLGLQETLKKELGSFFPSLSQSQPPDRPGAATVLP